MAKLYDSDLSLRVAPMTREEITTDPPDHKAYYVEGVVYITEQEIIDNDFEGFLDIVSNRLVGVGVLSDVEYQLVGCDTKSDELYYKVSGFVEGME